MILPNEPEQESLKNNSARTTIRFELAPSTMITVVLGIAVLWLLFKLVPVFLALIVAFFIVGTLNPGVKWLESKNCSRGLAIAIVFVSLVFVTLVVGILTIPALLTQASS